MGGPILLPRIAASLVRGHLTRNRWRPNHCFGDDPHVYTARAGLLDIDLLGHMNNAAYLTHCELARWELFTQSGLIHWSMKRRAGFVLAHASMRYRREIRAFVPFELRTRVVAADDKSIFMTQGFHPLGGGPLLAQGLARAVLVGKTTIHPREFLAAAGADEARIDLVSSAEASADPTVQAAQTMERAMRAAAAASDPPRES